VVCLRVGEPTGAPVAPSSADGWCVDRLVGETGVAVSFEFQSTAVAARLASLLEAARPIPLTRSEVRLDKRAVYGLVAEPRTAVRAEEAAGRIEAADAFRILSASDDVHDAVFNARPVPLTDQVRLGRQRVSDPCTRPAASCRRRVSDTTPR
jgi:hypothetical protein